MSPAADSVIRRLEGARDRWWLFTLLSTMTAAGCVSLGVLLVFLLADALITLPRLILLGLFLIWVALNVLLLVLVSRRSARSQRSIEAAARRVELEYPELGSSLINLVQLSEENGAAEPAFCRAAVDEAVSEIGHAHFEDAAARQSRWGRFIACMQTPRDFGESIGVLTLLILLAVICHTSLAGWGSAAKRLMSPWKYVPVVGDVGKIEVMPGDAEVLLGSGLRISAKISNPESKPYEARLLITPEGEEETPLIMAAGEKHANYAFTLPSVVKPLTYRLEIGDSQTSVYTLSVREKPTIKEVEVTFRYPNYLGRGQETFKQPHADLQAPQGTIAKLRIYPSVPVAKGHIQAESERYIGRVEEGGRVLVIDEMPLLRDMTFTVHLVNDAGHSDPDPRLNRIHVLLDKPPTVELLKPSRQSSSAPGASVPVMIRASDDYGVARLRLEMKTSDAQPDGEATQPDDKTPAMVVREWTQFETATAVLSRHELALKPEEVKPGQTVLVRAVVRDGRMIDSHGLELDRQEAATPWHAIRLIAPQERAAAALEQVDNLRQAIWAILEKQIRARVKAATILNQPELPARLELAGEVRHSQVEVQQTALVVVKSIGKTDQADRLQIKQVLNALATGKMLDAVRQGDALVKLQAVEPIDRAVAPLTATQDQIIEVLRKLLNVTRRAQSEVLSEMEKRPGGDLPDDVQQKLEEAHDKLDEFLEQQKKVIEATKDLAKTPVDDFGEEEEQKLKELAATEDDWSKFMKDLHSDLSKLPEQDFANASMLKELVEIQTEIKMAEDALLKKTADIAVPLEQLGYEMAEEMKTNLEKWLPDTPDRERWSQEESLSDADKEAPMAELPGELEDLIGELMEEEEDLFDEMEDISSSAADSLDKGAGWDVMDGPISNMSAKGATGNRLPNTSEIGGRSGEGRSGKSSGEFVGDEAIGKGGRKTPSRLTPDAYMKGQIKDHSKDPTGGATGGGKESGQGGEGLEGPLPGSPGKRDLQRLAGKQAALRNQAEGIDLKFQIMNFHHTDLKNLIEVMAQIERDLQAGRYQNALRQRKVLIDGLGNVKQYVDGEFEIRQDTTSNLPADIQDKILGSMEDPSPAGWEELNREYFERLSSEGGN